MIDNEQSRPLVRTILRCARVGSSLISETSGTVVQTCERCAHDIHVTPESLEKTKRESSLYVVICDECVHDPQLPAFLAEKSANADDQSSPGGSVRSLQIGGDDFGVIHAKKTVYESRIWLTAKTDATWWVVIEGPDQKIRTVGFVRPPQEDRAREIYDSLSKRDVLTALLEGRDS